MTVALYSRALSELRKVVVGQEPVLREALLALFTGGHVLLEGVPGVAKTLLVRAMAETFHVPFKRVQFTPDLLPADLIGVNVYRPDTGEFVLRHGPIFTTFLLADEINRTPPKTQAGLLEAMQERQATIDGVRFPLPPGFMVFATQNPVEQEGTYPLPEAQLDRFLMKIVVPYPTRDAEIELLQRHADGFDSSQLELAGVNRVGDEADYLAFRAEAVKVTVRPEINRYLAELLGASRTHELVLLGASPRAGVALLRTAQTVAYLEERAFVVPDDVKEILRPVLRHRLLLKPEAEIEGATPDQVIAEIADRVPIPR
ncbi:MAG: MoxR family ATPase [bacterium]